MANRHKSAKSVFISALFLLLLLFLNTKDASAYFCRAYINDADRPSAAPLVLSFTATQGGSNPVDQIFTVKNAGSNTMLWWVDETSFSWLSLSPHPTAANSCSGASGLGGGASQPATISINISGLSAETYNQDITIRAGDSGCGSDTHLGNKPQKVQVTLTVNPAPARVIPIPKAPAALKGAALSTDTIRWNFKDNADNETGFKIYAPINNILMLVADSGIFIATDLTHLDEKGLKSNTQYSGRVARSFSGQWDSKFSEEFLPVYTLIESPKALILKNKTKDSITVEVQEQLSNLNLDQSGVFFELKEIAVNSGWVKEISWAAAGLKSNTTYNFRVKARNGDGIETSFSEYFSFATLLEEAPPEIQPIIPPTPIIKAPELPALASPTAPISEQIAAIETRIKALQDLIKQLLSQITAPISPGFSFTKDLFLGIEDFDVKNLQIALNSDPDTSLEVLIGSPGSFGNETEYFGSATQKAVQKFQLKHGIIKSPSDFGAGFVGPKTRAKLNELYVK